tara:strand:+ start:177 stop:407 length:231 start_codon:yes stop_codon:yes gene_type:complete
MTEPVYSTPMSGSVAPIETYVRYTINKGGGDVTHVTREYEMDGPVTKVSESSFTIYDRYGQLVEINKENSTVEILA